LLEALLYLASFGIGAGSAVQSSMNGALGRIIGVVQATFISVSVTLLSVVVLMLLGFGSGGSLSRITTVPWYLLLGGFFGVAFIITANKTVPIIGVGAFLTLVILGQLAGSMLLDQFGAFGNPQRDIDLPRALGIVLMLVGMKLVIR